MKIPAHLQKSLLAICAMVGLLSLGLQISLGQPVAPQQPNTPTDSQTQDFEQRTGPFVIGGQNYSVVLHEKRLASVSDSTLASTLVGVEIADAAGNVSYQKAFSYAIG
jgi:hypothetical protein